MLFICVAVFATGTLATWLWFLPPVPAALKGPHAAATAEVVSHEFLDERSVDLDYRWEPPTSLASGLSGRITSTACSTDAVIESGASFAAVNESPLIALATSIPLWRDLTFGDRGDDVASLQAELQRLGFATTTDGIVGVATLTSIAKLFATVGDEIDGGTLPHGRIVWLPGSTATIDSCGARLGSSIEVGGTLASVSARLVRVSLADIPADLIAGDRNLTVDSASVPIGEDGAVSDPEALDVLAMTPAVRKALASTHEEGDPGASANPLSAKLSLISPVMVGAIPPTAIYSISNNRGCVTSSGASYPVSIAGSQLGQTYVIFDSPSVVKNVELSKKAQLPCT